MLGDILHLDRIAQIGLVASVFGYRLVIGDARKRAVDRLALGELLKHTVHDRLDRGEHVVLRNEAHLHVELIELAR